MRSVFITAAFFLVPAFASASTFFSDPRLSVNPLSPTQFEVIEARGAGARDIWCAAARYAVNTLGRDRGRIWIAVPRGPAQTKANAKGVTFTTDQVGSAASSVSVSVRTAGQSLRVIHALQFCKDYIIEPEDRF